MLRALHAVKGRSNSVRAQHQVRARGGKRLTESLEAEPEICPFCTSRRAKTASIGTKHHSPMSAFANRLNTSVKSALSLTTCPAASKAQAPGFEDHTAVSNVSHSLHELFRVTDVTIKCSVKS